jgi:beta-lactam-binding protein with PASTA domain
VLYTDNFTPEETVSVPNVEGLSKEYAQQLLASYGLNMTVEGSAASATNVYAVANETAGTTVKVGTAIAVSFQEYTVQSQ